MEDNWFPIAIAAAVLGGTLRAVLNRRKHGAEVADRAPVAGLDTPTRSVYRTYNPGVWTLALLIPFTLFLLAIGTGDTDVLGVALFTIPFAGVGLRMAQMGIFPDERGIKVVNFFTTKHYAWDAIARFEVRDYPSGGVLIDQNGQEHALTALQKGNPIIREDKTVDGLVAELNALLTNHRKSESN